MMLRRYRPAFILTLLPLWLIGCADPGDTGEPKANEEETGPTAFGPMTDAIDEAQAIEAAGQQRKDRMDAVLDEGSNEAPQDPR